MLADSTGENKNASLAAPGAFQPPIMTAKPIPAGAGGRDKSKSLAAMFPAPARGQGPNPSPSLQCRVVSTPATAAANNLPGAVQLGGSSPSMPGSSPTSLPQAQSASAFPGVQAMPERPPAFVLEAVVNGAGHRLCAPSERPARFRVGREVQSADVWARLVPCEASRGSISREHFEIRESADSPTGFVLANLSSTGTVLNGQLIQKESQIEAGDVLTVGLDQSPAALQAAKNPLMPRRAALQMYFVVPPDASSGSMVPPFCAHLECISLSGRTQQQLAQIPEASRVLQGNGAAGPKAALLRVGRSMQLPMWWETLFTDERLANGISREHFQIRAGDSGRPVLLNISQMGTLVNGEHVRQNQSKPINSEDTISILNKHDNELLVSFRFKALDVATGRILSFEAPRETAWQSAASKSALSAVQCLAGDVPATAIQMKAAKPEPDENLLLAAQSIHTERGIPKACSVPAGAPQHFLPQAAVPDPASVEGQEKLLRAAQSIGTEMPPVRAPSRDLLQAAAALGTEVMDATEGSGGTSAIGTRETASSWMLKCIASHGWESSQQATNTSLTQLVSALPEIRRHLLPADGSSALKIGRLVQPPEFWVRLVPGEWARNTISRECFEIAFDSLDASGTAIFSFRNLSSAGTAVNRRRVHSEAKLRLGDVIGIGAIQASAGSSELLPVIEFELAFADDASTQRRFSKDSNETSSQPRNSVESAGTQPRNSCEGAGTRSSTMADYMEPAKTGPIVGGRSASPATRSSTMADYMDPPKTSPIDGGRSASPSGRPFGALLSPAEAPTSQPSQIPSPRNQSPRARSPSPAARPAFPMSGPLLSEAPLMSRVTPQGHWPQMAGAEGAPVSPRQGDASPRQGYLNSMTGCEASFAGSGSNQISEQPSPSKASSPPGVPAVISFGHSKLSGVYQSQNMVDSAQFGQWPTGGAEQPNGGYSPMQQATDSNGPIPPTAAPRRTPAEQYSGLPSSVLRTVSSGGESPISNVLSPPLKSFTVLPANSEENTGAVPMKTFGSLALVKMEDHESQMWMLESSVAATERALSAGQMSPEEARDELAQIEAKLVRLQCHGIDSVALSGMQSASADEARDLKKELTRKAENLQNRMEEIFARLQRRS